MSRDMPPADAQSDPSITSDSECHLLELPAELRNRIYRLVLLEKNFIGVDSTGFERGALVSTCKQIRSEALKIFYYENIFGIKAPQWNLDAVFFFTRHSQEIDLDAAQGAYVDENHVAQFENENAGTRIVVDTSTDPTPNWVNFLEYIRRVHSSEVGIPSLGDNRKSWLRQIGHNGVEETSIFLCATAAMARRLRDKDWSLVKGVVENRRVLLGMLDGRWMEDEVEA